jgi:(p)ppGpp synthase/HD superfamily hydrolase
MASSSVFLAEQIARQAHSGTVTKTGEDYINHPRRVVINVREIPDWSVFSDAHREALECAAWLHDVVEDNPNFTLDSLRSEGIPELAIAVVALLSKNLDVHGNMLSEHVAEGVYLTRIRSHPLALRVKLADLADNSNVIRQREYAHMVASGALSPNKDPDRYPRYVAALDPDVEFGEWFARRILLDPHMP